MADMLHQAGDYLHKHPVMIVGGVLALYVAWNLLRGGGGGGDTSGAAAFYQAQSADAISGNQLQATQIAAQAQTAQVLDTNAANVTIQGHWADTALAETTSNNQAAVSMAPYAVESNLISTLGQVASLPPTTTTKSSGWNFLGIGSQSTSTTVHQNPNAGAAGSALDQLATGLYPQH